MIRQVHDEEADRRREREAEANVAGGMDSLVVMPPAIEVQQKWLVTNVVKAEYLPVMDKNFAGGAGGGDFFFQARGATSCRVSPFSFRLFAAARKGVCCVVLCIVRYVCTLCRKRTPAGVSHSVDVFHPAACMSCVSIVLVG